MARNRANPGPEKPVDDKVESELHQLEAADDTQFYNVDPEIERKVVRKLDCVILPLMVLVYFFQCQPISWYSFSFESNYSSRPRQADN